jgi:hypothetical protein
MHGSEGVFMAPRARLTGGQVPTHPATILEIMASAEFALGVADARAGRPYRDGYQAWRTNAQWNYERGRQWARLVPASVVLKHNGQITREAAEWSRRQFKDIL